MNGPEVVDPAMDAALTGSVFSSDEGGSILETPLTGMMLHTYPFRMGVDVELVTGHQVLFIFADTVVGLQLVARIPIVTVAQQNEMKNLFECVPLVGSPTDFEAK